MSTTEVLTGEVTRESVVDERGRRLTDVEWVLVSGLRRKFPDLHRYDPGAILEMVAAAQRLYPSPSGKAE